jgi:release factor glutamine methyltransferase
VTAPATRSATVRVGPVLHRAVERLRAAGIATARQDAELLLAGLAGTTRLALHLEPDRPLAPATLGEFEGLVTRRAGHEPLQYIVGREDFHGLSFQVGPGVFIPRPETELLVERAVAGGPAGPVVAVDLCTGSGAVACALAARRPQGRVWAVELSAAAAAWARTNAATHRLAGRVTVLEGDLWAPLEARGLVGGVDLAVANPPYLARPTLAGLPGEVRDWEPILALDGGSDGLAVLERILADAPRFVRPGGRVVLEIGHDHAGRLAARLAGDRRYRRPAFHRDLAGHDRVLEVEVG